MDRKVNEGETVRIVISKDNLPSLKIHSCSKEFFADVARWSRTVRVPNPRQYVLQNMGNNSFAMEEQLGIINVYVFKIMSHTLMRIAVRDLMRMISVAAIRKFALLVVLVTSHTFDPRRVVSIFHVMKKTLILHAKGLNPHFLPNLTKVTSSLPHLLRRYPQIILLMTTTLHQRPIQLL